MPLIPAKAYLDRAQISIALYLVVETVIPKIPCASMLRVGSAYQV
jgi:hypothetical protein